ncbi:MAG: hypothetical protein IPM35_28925 [Myxococcales bacterium]|nr:hypothetical protein [Myxococcales bacterium]
METILVRYTVRPERAEENAAAIRAVFTALEAERPDGVRYAAFRLPDGVSFVHLAQIETADGSNPLSTLEAFRAFTSTIKERCESPPVAAVVEPIGSYRFSP